MVKLGKVIDNFFSYELWIVMSAILGVPALITVVVVTANKRWSNSDDLHFGLWKYCTKNVTFTCCSSFPNTFGSTPKWLEATIVFMIMASLSACLTLIVTCVTMCSTERGENNIHRYIRIGFSLVTAFLLLIALAIYADWSHKEYWSKSTRVSVSFVSVIVVIVMYMGSALANYKVTSEVGVSKDYPPTYWTRYTSDKSLTEWIAPGNNTQPELVDVTDEDDGKDIKMLFMNLWQEPLAGHGKDATGSGYRKVSITKIERIENPVSFEKYIDNKKKFKRYSDKIKAVKDIKGSRSGVLTTIKVSDSFLTRTGVDLDINEHFLFHGCKTDIHEFVKECGLDLRKAKMGMLGRGTYGAEDPTKSDQYTGDELPNRKMFLMRVLLGDMFLIKGPNENFTNPPCKKCAEKGHLGNCKNADHLKCRNDWQFDSVLYDSKHKFREFVVYDQHRCYPEYLITYNRIPIKSK